MTADVEYEGKNVKDALRRAGEALGLSVDSINYDILSHGSTGIFGLVGVKKARIRISQPIAAPSAKNAFRKGGSRKAAEKRVSIRDSVSLTPDDSEDARFFTSEENPPQWQPVPNAEITPDIISQCRTAVKTIAGAISDDIDVMDECINGRVVLNLVGGNSGALIGKRGQTLEAIQYLVEKIINKGRDDRVRVLVDVEGYLESRRNNLQQLAGRMAEKAKQKGRPTTIGQMNAHDRRIIHLALKDDASVRTQSVGEGHFRKLVIYPKSTQQRRRRGQHLASQQR
ncbi:MAG: RNA-binding cell elongation regulator Jag/EloR [Pseudomonadota bacterium]